MGLDLIQNQLLIINKQKNTKFYQLNLEEVDKPFEE